jgi:hypothetical protein
MKQVGRIEYMLRRAKAVSLETSLSGRELFGRQEELLEPSEKFLRKYTEILKEHKVSKKQWGDVMSMAGSFYFVEEPWMEEINLAIRSAGRELGMPAWTNSPMYSIDYAYGELHNTAKRGTIQREKVGKVYRYWV